MTAPEVGVLLPVRLETRFIEPTRDQPWILRVRLIPDAVSISNHADGATDIELDAVETLWRTAQGQNLESDLGKQAWRVFSAAIDADRAAWLARTFPPEPESGPSFTIQRPASRRTGMRAPHMLGLPTSAQIWIARGGKAATVAATLRLQVEQITLDLDDSDQTDEPWWSSFKEAVRVGMATEIKLGSVRPVDIDALYVVGIGAGDPGPWLSSQVDAGRLGLITPGSATNTVNGKHAHLMGDATTWRHLAQTKNASQPGTTAVASVLSKTPGISIKAVPGGEHDHLPLNNALISTLWPTLWGHGLGNIEGYGARADELGVWAAQNLVPEGPLPSLRITDQPFALLPATSLKRWKRKKNDPDIENFLIPLVEKLRRQWLAAVLKHSQGKSTNALEALVSNPTASRYTWRSVMSTELVEAVSFRFGEKIPQGQLNQWWDKRVDQSLRLDPKSEPAQRLVSVGWSHALNMDLVSSNQAQSERTLLDELGKLQRMSMSQILLERPEDGKRSRTQPSSLLIELARHALLNSAAAVARNSSGQSRLIVEPLSVDQRQPTQIDTWSKRIQINDLRQRSDPATRIHRNVLNGLQRLENEAPADIERGLRATLDTATRRLDPWATAIAWRRLQSLSDAPRNLGIYGWVDAPRPRSTQPKHQYLLAPSIEQASTSAILRDRALHDIDSDRWQMDLNSESVQLALKLAKESQQGTHVAESLGRQVEAIVSKPQLIDKLRRSFPLYRHVQRRAAMLRRVCNGAAVLKAVEANPDKLTELGLLRRHLRALEKLAQGIDALADLHMAEATHALVKGRPAAVSAASASAAGQALPPDFDVVRTPRSARAVNTFVFAVLPDIAATAGPLPSPIDVADPAVAQFLDRHSGDPSGEQWTWSTLQSNGDIGSVTLADVGIRPCDTVALGDAHLRDLVLGFTRADKLVGQSPEGHAIVRSVALTLSGVPGTAAALQGRSANDDATIAELMERFQRLRTAAVDAVADARQAASASDAVQRAALRHLARWGITPLANSVEPLTESVQDRVLSAAEGLEGRLRRAPSTEQIVEEPAALAEIIVSLAVGEGPLPVFSRVPISALSTIHLDNDTSGSTTRLDPEWIETIAPVRPPIARLEAFQLDQRLKVNGDAFDAWTNRPGDPWQTVVEQTSNLTLRRPSKLMAVFGPRGVLPDAPDQAATDTVALTLLDEFSEQIPDTEHVAGVAFSHDVPPARAPQAVILAVPPDVDDELTPEVLVDIVSEVRDLARVRMADPDTMGLTTGILHKATIPAAGRSGVDLETQ